MAGNAKAWIAQLQERAAAHGYHVPEPEDEPAAGNSTIRFQNHRAHKEGAGGFGLTPEQWIAILEGQFYRCFYCHKILPLEIEHHTPIALGGLHDASNIVGACKSCNASKRNTPHLVWLATRAAKNQRVGANA